ncbi:NrfD/PsrC family molybdoenzyme membrane anchor subunit [uncultured Slackia sp.]|uniref:NrfD/PsrC family molybdoenzyme membrane anchor subunit n=1 Tax=uncultured Slackia sp. TaxID=665903 RepID=UPI0026E07BB5|nr:NrfD/PsrC family molybdoenzyme membrane anchor subunit [uncultured Slackia sp.]
MFGPLIIMYLFLGGCGAGMLLVSSLWSLVFHARANRTFRQSAAFRTFRNRCFVAGAIVVCLGAVCLLADLGRPERFVLLFFRPNETYLTFGTFVLAALAAVASFLSAVNCLYLPRFDARAKVVAEVLCAFLSVAVMTYTGLFLQGLYAVAFWDTWLVPALFVLSAVSMGISACLLVSAFMRDGWLYGRDIGRMHAIHVFVLIVEAFALAAFLATAAFGRGEAPASFALLLHDPLLSWFAAGVVLCGLAVPLIGESVLRARRIERALPLIDALCIFGGLALRICIVSAGLH